MKSIADTKSAVRESLRRRLLPSVLTSKMMRERPTTGCNARGFNKDESVLLEAVEAREADPDEERIRKLTGEREQLQAQIQETSIIETRRPLVEKATKLDREIGTLHPRSSRGSEVAVRRIEKQR